MGKTVQTNLRLDSEVRDRAIAAADAQGMLLARFVERAIEAYLDGVAADSATVARDSGVVAADIVARLEAIEKRLGESRAA